jgi:hypothetical protein
LLFPESDDAAPAEATDDAAPPTILENACFKSFNICLRLL